MSVQATIYDILQKEHRRQSALLEHLKKSRDARTRALLFEKLATDLGAHAEAESVTLYSVLRAYPETRAVTEQAEEEHDRIADLLQQLEAARENLATWEHKLDELRQAVEQHVESEEEEMFPEAQGILDDVQSRALAIRFRAEKNERNA